MLCRDLLTLDKDVETIHLGEVSPEPEVTRLSLAKEARQGCLTFVKNGKFLKALEEGTAGRTELGAAVFDRKLWFSLDEAKRAQWQRGFSVIALSTNVPLTMAKFSEAIYLEQFQDQQNFVDGRQMGTTEIHPTALIGQGVFVGEHVKIGANVVIHPGVTICSQVEIAAETVLYPQVVIYPRTKIGERVRIHAHTSVGSDGFGYVFHQGVHHKIWHMGGVIIHDDVEIGSNCSIDMGTFTATEIGAGTKIDNQVQIAHNVKIGRGCILCGQSGVAGSATLGDFVVLGGRVAVGPDAHLGQGTQVAGGGMVNENSNWPPGSILGGHPARDLKEWMRTFAWLRKNALKD